MKASTTRRQFSKLKRVVSLLAFLATLHLAENQSSCLCCLRSLDPCNCPQLRISANGSKSFGMCPQWIDAKQFIGQPLYVTVSKPLEDGLYTVVGFGHDEFRGRERAMVAWLTFLSINVATRDCVGSTVCRLNLLHRFAVSACGTHETRMDVYMISQKRQLNEGDFAWDESQLDMLSFNAQPNTIYYGHFRDPDLYNGYPVAGTRYTLQKCPAELELQQIVTKTDEAYGAVDIENYLFAESDEYKQRLFKMESGVHITEHMMNEELTDCDFSRELLREHYMSSLHHNREICRRFDKTAWITHMRDIGEERKASRIIQKHIEEWMTRLKPRIGLVYKINIESAYSHQLAQPESGPGEGGDENDDSEDENLDSIFINRHFIKPIYARSYWKIYYQACRITTKVEWFTILFKNLTGQLPEFYATEGDLS